MRAVAKIGKMKRVGAHDEPNERGELQPDRYYLLSDAGSFYFDPGGDNDGFDSPQAAAEWARAQTTWPELDLSDGYAVAIVLGSEFNANQAVWDAWEGGEFPDAPPVHNYARDLGLVRRDRGDVVRKHRRLLDRLRWR
jgi:hypothetical protein